MFSDLTAHIFEVPIDYALHTSLYDELSAIRAEMAATIRKLGEIDSRSGTAVTFSRPYGGRLGIDGQADHGNERRQYGKIRLAVGTSTARELPG